MTRKRSKDPLQAAITTYIWPELKSRGFIKASNRVFAKEINGVLQRIHVDAAGFSGRGSVYFLYEAEPICTYKAESFLLGYRFKDESFDMSTHELADSAAQRLIILFSNELYPWFDQNSTVEGIYNTLNSRDYYPIESANLLKAICRLILGDSEGGKRYIDELRSSKREYLFADDGPALLISQAIIANSTDILFEGWADINREKYKLRNA